ncbi:hypothetical protein Q4603_05860 [Zobellia galactanivorans]|uniref:hypothetical protein n=1 Tax=Zobellia galactanivorans (strain DSM 12802 / CCUG 47099 / CIP 106680 / NCIMB 13871 / Dsij) TaxID=63186 RepID=UPI0026E2B92C|nr:hypothetical protein [Zobellia galactanivorans]MDO6808121.1 hypothetical protein [Zobellia galactanivorans]
MRILNPSQRRKINKAALAEKHDCSAEYVSQLLAGRKKPSTDKAKAIIADSMAIIEVLEPKKSA